MMEIVGAARRLLALLVAWGTLTSQAHAQSTHPNVLWLSYEDSSPHLGCYGDKHARTPNVDRFASEGVRYLNAFTNAGVCAPSRSGIISGCFPSSLGSNHMRSKALLPPAIKPFPYYLRQAGYYCANNSKEDYNFDTPAGTWDESSARAHYKNRQPGQQFFAVFNFTQSHESQFHGGRAFPGVAKTDPASLTLPPYYPDTPLVRRDWAQNYDSIAFVDGLIGKALKEVDDAGLANDTIVFIWSDHGDGLPRAKRWLYDSGTRIPLLVRMPPKFRTAGQGQPGTTADELVAGPDLGMTVLNLASLPLPPHAQGRAFLGPRLSPRRDYVFAARDRMDERYDLIRSVRDQRFRYVRNFEPWKPYAQLIGYCERGAVMQELRRTAAEGTLPAGARLFMSGKKPTEELYDTLVDPHEINNLANVPEHQDTLKRLRTALERWQEETLDLGFLPEPILQELAKKAGSHWQILRQPGGASLVRDLRHVATLYEKGPAVIGELQTRLQDGNPAIRYWAMVGLTQLLLDARADVVPLARAATQDAAQVVRVVAARALWLAKQVDDALAVLIAVLGDSDDWNRLAAVLVLDEMGAQARPAVDALRRAKATRQEYVDRVVDGVLARLE